MKVKQLFQGMFKKLCKLFKNELEQHPPQNY